MSTSFKYNRLSKDDAALLLVDHQAGLISLVQDFSPSEFKNNVLAVAACGRYFKLPTILRHLAKINCWFRFWEPGYNSTCRETYPA